MITRRRYKILVDFERAHKFLTETYDAETLNSFLIPQYFEYAHMYPLDYTKTHHFGIWEDDGKIVGIACFEMNLGYCCHLHTHKDYRFLTPELLEWAECELCEIKDGKRKLEIWIAGSEQDKRELLQSAGFSLSFSEPRKIFNYDKPFPERKLPEGFTLLIGNENIDLKKLQLCFWKGFDHEGEPDYDVDHLLFGYEAPISEKFMTAAVAPDGEYACALGMWVDEANQYAYLEPLATVPEYRRMGLATICLVEAMKKTKERGAKYCFCGSREFYTAIGCENLMDWELWKKEW